jgi:Raf kinase inhibitor-like YbhB/YbcL family protein
VNNREKARLTVSSSAFENGGMMPPKYTRQGENVSPPISWSGAPESTRTFVVLAEDRDAPASWLPLFIWVHWLVYDIPSNVTSLPEAVRPHETLDSGARQGVTSFRRIGYGGPWPLFGTHRYFFRVYAVEVAVELQPRKATKKSILKAIEGHVTGYGELVGRYKRSGRL